MTSASNIRPVDAQEIGAFLDHLARHIPSSDHNGSPTKPQLAEEMLTREQNASRLCEAWARSIAEPGWTRSWALCNKDQFVGHVQLRGGKLRSELHRATLGIGLEVAYRSQGHGRLLLETALSWSREVTLEWIDLCVFSDNVSAIRLYQRFGFRRVGHVVDRFRLNEKKIDEFQMTLQLR
jgi:ribosomal protein S18 acetylase RimI-like enzyme